MNASRIATTVALVLMTAVLCGCHAFQIGITNEDPAKAKPLDTKYDQNDLRQMPDEILQKILAIPFPPQGVDKPLIVVWNIQNRTQSHLDMKALADTLTVKMLDTNRFRFIENSRRDDLLKEQGYQMANCDAAQRVNIGKQLGAKYMLTGSLTEIDQKSGREVRVSSKEDVFFQLTVELTDVQTGELVVKKQAERLRRANRPIIGW